LRLVDLAHAAATDEEAELESTDGLVGVAARAADLERAVELGACFGEERLALGNAAHGLLELHDVLERHALARARRVESDEVEELDHREHAELVDRLQVLDVDDAAIDDDARRDQEDEHAV
jgi:hypothetical protein